MQKVEQKTRMRLDSEAKKTGNESGIKKKIKGEIDEKKEKSEKSSNKIRYCTVYIIVYSLLSVGKYNIFIYLECELFIYKLYGLIVFTTTSVNDAMYIQTTFSEYR